MVLSSSPKLAEVRQGLLKFAQIRNGSLRYAKFRQGSHGVFCDFPGFSQVLPSSLSSSDVLWRLVSLCEVLSSCFKLSHVLSRSRTVSKDSPGFSVLPGSLMFSSSLSLTTNLRGSLCIPKVIYDSQRSRTDLSGHQGFSSVLNDSQRFTMVV